MGRINRIWNVEDWKIVFEGKNILNQEDIVYKMEIGESDDYGISSITEFISKNNYERLLNKIYEIEIFPYTQTPILLLDDSGKNIPLVNFRNSNSLDELNSEQIIFLNKKELDRSERMKNNSNKVVLGLEEHTCFVDLKQKSINDEFDEVVYGKPKALVKKIITKIIPKNKR